MVATLDDKTSKVEQMVEKILNGENPDEEEIAKALGEDAGMLPQEHESNIREEAQKRAMLELNQREWEVQKGESAVIRATGSTLGFSGTPAEQMVAWEKWLAAEKLAAKEASGMGRWTNWRNSMLDRIWSHPKASPEAKAEARFLVRQCRRDQSWVEVAKEVTRILEGEIEEREERNRKFAEVKRRIVAADPMAMVFPQLMILPDAEPVATRIMLEEIRVGLARDPQPVGNRVKRPDLWKL